MFFFFSLKFKSKIEDILNEHKFKYQKHLDFRSGVT